MPLLALLPRTKIGKKFGKEIRVRVPQVYDNGNTQRLKKGANSQTA